jgi:hypothetical protein
VTARFGSGQRPPLPGLKVPRSPFRRSPAWPAILAQAAGANGSVAIGGLGGLGGAAAVLGSGLAARKCLLASGTAFRGGALAGFPVTFHRHAYPRVGTFLYKRREFLVPSRLALGAYGGGS